MGFSRIKDLTSLTNYAIILTMEQIKRTTLTEQDITEHHAMLEQQHCIDLFLPADRRQEVADEMVLRFVETFLEDLEL